jgi:hypothetical protein
MSSYRLLVLASSMALALSVSACNLHFVKSMAAAARLQQALEKRFRGESINVNVTNASVTVGFINSPLNEKSDEDRRLRALDTALFTRDSYTEMQSINELWVVFLKQESKNIVLKTTEFVDSFGFSKNAQLLGTEPRELGPGNLPLQPQIIPYTDSNQTEVSLADMKLQTTEQDEVSLSVLYTVPGQIDKANLGKPPDTVRFRFSVFSETDHVSGETAVEFFSDDKSVFKTMGKYEDSTATDGRYLDYLAVNVSYNQFRRLTDGSKVRFELGNHAYTITEEQLGAMRKMRSYVRE